MKISKKLKALFLNYLFVTVPTLILVMTLFIVSNSKRPLENESIYRQALKNIDGRSSSPSVFLASKLGAQPGLAKFQKTIQLSDIEIFNDKLSLPHPQLSYLLEELESEHKEILKSASPISSEVAVHELDLRYRIVLATYLDKAVGDLNSKDLREIEVSQEHIYYLKKLANSQDLVLLMEKNKLNKDYLELKNLKKIYATDQDLKRSISGQ